MYLDLWSLANSYEAQHVSSRLKVHQIIIEKYPTLKYTSTYHAEILDTWKGAGEIDQVDTETGYSANVLTGWQVPAGH